MRKRGTREFWTKIVDEFEQTSGETHAVFAARHGVEKATFERWLYLLREERRKRRAGAVRLLPVHVAVEPNEPAVLVELGSGLALRVTAGTDPSYVATLVTALRSC
jgi:transposase-like protein